MLILQIALGILLAKMLPRITAWLWNSFVDFFHWVTSIDGKLAFLLMIAAVLALCILPGV